MRRGDLRRYVRPSSPDVSRIVVILSSDGDLTRLYRAWMGEHVGQLDAFTLTRLTEVVQAALDL